MITTNAAPQSKATTANPKDLMGSKKIPLGQVCPVAMAHEACAMLDGDLKYGYRNWRDKKVVARIYIDAALRHLQAWTEGEETAPDSGVHHLGHARACLGILLDAQETGNLIDDRVKGSFPATAKRLEGWVTERMKREIISAALQKQPAIQFELGQTAVSVTGGSFHGVSNNEYASVTVRDF